MNKTLSKIMLFAFLFILSSGCLVTHSVNYKIELNEDKSGIATVTFSDIRSDALTDEDFEEDCNTLFNYIESSEQFIEDMKNEGKFIISRNITVTENKLKGMISYEFYNIENVENLISQDGLIFLTIAPEDSVISTNGGVIVSDEFKRIIWEDSMDVLEFSIYSEPDSYTILKDLKDFYKKAK